ncbi:MAG: flavin reductase family protein [Paludibacteraceae bacterium]|nr:flavin reductase family protein [Paludibacteraceae bacterium]
MKIDWRPGNMLYPLPAVLVSCANREGEKNLLTVAWTGTLCSDPALCYVSIRPTRKSYQYIKDTGEFVINLTNERLSKATDWCGVRSGRDYDKWKEMGLTPSGSHKLLYAPIVEESPLSIECRVKQVIPLGTHDLFIGEVVNVQVDETFIDAATGAFDEKKASLLVYEHGKYYKTGEFVGKFGWSVERKKQKKQSLNKVKLNKENQ